MAVSKEEIKKLADLARIEIDEKEAESLSTEIDAILDYVKIINEFHSDGAKADGVEEELLADTYNVMRDDENPNETGSQSKELIAEFPRKEGDYLKVKKIL